MGESRGGRPAGAVSVLGRLGLHHRDRHPDRRRLVRAVKLAACFLGLVLAGCHSSERKVIAVVPKATSHLFWQSIQAGALAAGKKFQVEILWNGPSTETEYSRQIQIVDSMIARKVDGLAVAAADRTALNASLDRAAQA
ncbi:MAG: substrate-binding domain-containing protein, partial [Acidobacteria bacterium]|nr:substrate-binding domain-containing protein [Acidobacteriota bacterium]